MHLKAVSVPRILIAVHRCRHFIYTIITPKNNCARKYWNVYFPVFPSCELLKWAALGNSQSEQSRTVKQPIRAEPHCEIANQSRAALWNSQSEQSSTSLFMTLPNKPITDLFILGRNTRVVNAHVKPFLDHFCPYLSHIPSIDIREQIKILYQCIIYSSHILIFHFKICTYQTYTHIIVYIIYCVILLFCTLPCIICVLSCCCHSVAL